MLLKINFVFSSVLKFIVFLIIFAPQFGYDVLLFDLMLPIIAISFIVWCYLVFLRKSENNTYWILTSIGPGTFLFGFLLLLLFFGEIGPFGLSEEFSVARMIPDLFALLCITITPLIGSLVTILVRNKINH